ncbi:MAG: universal stress protein, partial [Levilactobacillus brevis]
TEYVTRTAVCDVIVVRTDLDNQPAKAAHPAE